MALVDRPPVTGLAEPLGPVPNDVAALKKWLVARPVSLVGQVHVPAGGDPVPRRGRGGQGRSLAGWPAGLLVELEGATYAVIDFS